MEDESALSDNAQDMQDGHEKDLPLKSNISDIHIFHYILELKCSLEKKELCGSVTLFRCSDLRNCGTCCKNRNRHLLIKNNVVKLLKVDDKRSESDHDYIQTAYNCNGIDLHTLAEYRNATKTEDSKADCFKLVLDCCDIQIISVEEVDIPIDLICNIGKDECFCKFKTYARPVGLLKWLQDKHSVTIWKDRVSTEGDFPDVVRIEYKTLSTGQSLKWTIDQDEKWCVFTHGHWINNRSLFPSQDAPTAMATWDAEVEVKEHLEVVMSGDDVKRTSSSDVEGWKKEFFSTKMEMPSSTLSIAIGEWKRLKIDTKKLLMNSKKYKSYGNSLDCRIGIMKDCYMIGPSSIIDNGHLHFQEYVALCIKEITYYLGGHPFTRLDLLVVPPCFDSLGMACPSVMYLSQSVISKDCSMFVRISHEICHSWFGLLIGPKDWTEEWLTEGFCSYLEDILHIKVKQGMGLCNGTEEEERQLRNYLKYKTLVNELNTTDNDLQMLRPNKEPCSTSGYVKDGMNPDKRFLQVHYLKGHFLLCYLEKFVGTEQFLKMIHAFVVQFHKELVSSQDVIKFMFGALPELRKHVTEHQINWDWLDKPGMPWPLKDFQISKENSQFQLIEKQIAAVKQSYPKQGSRKRKRIENHALQLDNLTPLQQVLFLEMLLEEDKIPSHLLVSIKNFYTLMEQNADVQHRWCELVIKHKLQSHYHDLKYFLLNHQAMGVYLFGEMVLSGCKVQRELATECFDLLKDHMEPDPYSAVKAMVFGT